MPGFSFHPSLHPTAFHPGEAIHSTESKPVGNASAKPAAIVVKPGRDPFQPASAGLPASSPAKSMLKKITWPHQQGDYVVKTSDALDANGSRPIYRLDDETGTPVRTGERAKDDEHGNPQRLRNPDAAAPPSPAALPPAASVDPQTLVLNKHLGTYQVGSDRMLGGNDEHFLRVGEGLHAAKQEGSGWAVVDPGKSHTIAGSVPVKLDGKGGAEPLTKGGLKGGERTAAPLMQQALRARGDVAEKNGEFVDARNKARDAERVLAESKRGRAAASARKDGFYEEISVLDAQSSQLRSAYQRELDPARRESIGQSLAKVDDDLESRRNSWRDAADEESRLNDKVAVDKQAVVQTKAAVRGAEGRLQAAISLLQHLASEYAFANPDDAAGLNALIRY